MSSPSVLVGCPISHFKDYCLWEWLAMATTLDYPNYDLYLVDNSTNPEYHKDIKQLGIECDYFAPKGHPREFITKCQNQILSKAKNENYEYLLMLECDIFPPRDVIHRLIQHNKPVIGGHYLIYSGSETKSISASSRLIGNTLKIEHLSPLDLFFEIGTGIKRTRHLGLGCLLIRNDVFSKINFRVDPDESLPSDSYFHEDLFRMNIPCYVDTDLSCIHRSDSWGQEMDKLNELIEFQSNGENRNN